MNRHEPKPDDRSNNVERLADMIENTKENINEAEESLRFAEGEQREQIEAKNERRRESIKGMESEMEDERQARKNGYQ